MPRQVFEVLVQVGAGKPPPERLRSLSVVTLEAVDPLLDGVRAGEVTGVSALRTSIGKENSPWFSQLLWVGRYTARIRGSGAAIRARAVFG